MDHNRYLLPVSSILLLFLCFIITFTACIHDSDYVITGGVSINCGSTDIFAARDGIEWMGDAHNKFKSSLQINGKSTVSSVIHNSFSDDPIPYKTARISRSRFSYSFLLNPGQKFIRFHFNPTPYKGFKRLKDFFTVEAGPFILLRNFSASITADALGSLSSFTKEFCITIQENQPLNIIFSPATSQQSQDTYVFVNGIEIIPVPSGHSYFHDGGNVGAQVVGQESKRVHIDGSTALEMVHRFNVKQGGSDLSRDNMFGMWTTVPKGKKSLINNITWKISVDAGFNYMLRIHFSEQGLKSIAKADSVILKVLIKEVVANTNIDVVKERDNNNVFVMYMDYMVTVKGQKQEGKHDLLISLLSHNEFMDGHGGPLTGFEVFKLSNPDNSLASPNPLLPTRDSSSCTIQTLLSVICQRHAIATVAITIIALVNVTVHKLREIWEATRTEEENNPSARAERFSRRFSLSEIQLATKNFSDANIIGKGGFGRVYKGSIDNMRMIVAIKRLKAFSSQGAHEFLIEIETLSELRHINLISLIGYCNEKGEMILVYEYMANGTLADHLYKLARKGISCASLSWKQRLNICIGAGRGLDYLHTGNAVIHRDVKVSNILLDENFTAKVSDFGLVKHENRTKLQSHVSTKVKGTFGYIDPNYSLTGKLTRKSDIYAFGVVLLEVLCGRPPFDSRVANDEQILTKWARDKISKGEVDVIVASSLRGEISTGSLKAFVKVVERCLDDEPNKRPTIAQIVLQLEFALEQQETDALSNEETQQKTDARCNEEMQQKTNAPSNEETKLLVSEQQTMDEKTLTPPPTPPREKTNSNNMDNADLPSGRREGRKSTLYKTSSLWPWDALRNSNNMDNADLPSGQREGRKSTVNKTSNLWPWDALRNKIKPSKKVDFIIAGDGGGGGGGVEIPSIGETIAPNLKMFSLEELKSATRNFRPDTVLGEGGFGRVFKGWIDEKTLAPSKVGDGIPVAVKKSNPDSRQGLEEWQAEVKFLGKLKHPNLVKLLGYCWEEKQFILVYEYMQRGSLESHLFRKGAAEPIPWDTRIKIAIGAARGLAFLHSTEKKVIYRDFKPSNILLDGNFNAKLSDFGLAKLGPTDGSTHVTTRIMGTYGYSAPEYVATGYLYVKSDVYGFGVVLLEIITGLHVLDRNRPNGQTNLVEWAKPFLPNKKKLKTIMDPWLEDQYPSKGATQVAKLILSCLDPDLKHRPNMEEVLETLEKIGRIQMKPKPR